MTLTQHNNGPTFYPLELKLEPKGFVVWIDGLDFNLIKNASGLKESRRDPVGNAGGGSRPPQTPPFASAFGDTDVVI